MRLIAIGFLFGVLSGVGTTSAQHHGHSHGHHHGHGHVYGHGAGHYYGHGSSAYGLGIGGYGFRSTYLSTGSYFGTPGFSAGVISPYLGYGWGGGYYPSGGYYGGWGGGYGYGSSWGGYGPWGYARPYYGGFAAPPIILPTEYLYGPGPVRRLMGLDPPLGTSIVQQTIYSNPVATVVQKPVAQGGGFGVLAGGNAQMPPRPNVQATNAATQARALKLVEAGDAAFQKQRYADAFTQYKEAARTAPDMAEIYLRQAAASVALRRYDDAVASLKFGLRLSTTWVDGRFRIVGLYGDDRLAQAAHFDALAQAAIDRPSSDLLFLTGVMLYFNDPPQRAEPFLRRAAELVIGESWHIDVFEKAVQRLPAAAPVAQPPAPVQAKNDGGARDI